MATAGEVLNKAKRETVTKSDMEGMREREYKPLTPANLLSKSLGAGNEGRIEEELDFPKGTHFLGIAAQQSPPIPP